MKHKLLIIAPKLPEYPTNKRDARLSCIIEGLAKEYEVHFLYIQSLFAREETLQKFAEIGVKAIALQDMRKKQALKIEKQLEQLLLAEDYRAVVFTTYYTAKYCLPYLSNSLDDRRVVIDAGKSQFLLEMSFARKNDDLLKRRTLEKRAEINKLQELPIYTSADLVIVENETAKEIMAPELPYLTVGVVADLKDAGVDEATVQAQTVALFQSLFEQPARKVEKVAVEAFVVDTGNGDKATAVTEELLGEISHVLRSDEIKRVDIPIKDGESMVTAYNEALHRITGDFALILPEHALMSQQSLDRMLYALRSHPLNGIAVPSSNIQVGSLVDVRNMAEFLPKHYAANFGNWHEVRRTEEQALLLRREMVQALGLFDTRFTTLYYALFDYVLRAFQCNYRVFAITESLAYYRAAISYDQEKLERDRKLLFEKWCDLGTEYLESMAL